MGATVRSLVEAISWRLSEVVLSLFAVWPDQVERSIAAPLEATRPTVVRTYHLEDVDAVLAGKGMWEVDLVFPGVPSDLEPIVTGWLTNAIAAGAVLAWFGFEGSFSFKHLLTDDVANLVFGVAVPGAVSVALDDEFRFSAEWCDQLRTVRKGILLSIQSG